MAGIIFDTSVYISAFRNGDPDIFSVRATGTTVRPLWLSAVVLEELYAGASDASAQKALSKLEKDLGNVNRVLVPNQSDWTSTGRVLNKIGEKYGFEKIGKARLTNDVLIAMSAARTGLSILTVNTKDFKLIAEFRKFDWTVI